MSEEIAKSSRVRLTSICNVAVTDRLRNTTINLLSPYNWVHGNVIILSRHNASCQLKKEFRGMTLEEIKIKLDMLGIDTDVQSQV